MREPPSTAAAVLTDLLARAMIVVLFSLLSINLFGDFMRTGHVTGLLLLASESLVVILTVVRRRRALVDRSIAAAVMTTVSLAGPPLLRATPTTRRSLPDIVTALVSAARPVLVVVGKMALGRSFGIVPANRGVVVRGPYTLVRHPIYTGYLITHVAFLAAHPTPWNIGGDPDRGRGADRARADGRARAERRRRLPGVLPARRLAPRAGGVLAMVVSRRSHSSTSAPARRSRRPSSAR